MHLARVARRLRMRQTLRPRRAILEPLERRTLFAAVAWDGLGDGVRWSDPLNWNTDQVPGADDDVTIARSGTYTVALDAPGATAATLNLGGSSGTQLLAVSTSLSLTGDLSRVRSNGVLQVTGSLAGAPSVVLDNGGQVLLEAGSLGLLLRNS